MEGIRKIIRKDPRAFAGILLHYLLAFSVLLVLIFALRAGMNMLSRAVFITARLDDYPHLLQNYLSENEAWWDWWQKGDYQKRADQAAFFFDTDTAHADERAA